MKAAIYLVASFGLLACVTPVAQPNVHAATPLEAAVASGMAANELAKSKPEERVYGWKLEVVGDRARFFECSSEDTCGDHLVEVPAKALLGVKVVGRVHETDVLQFTIANDVMTSRGGVATDPHRGLTVGGRTK